MNIAKIIYISLIVLSASIFYICYFQPSLSHEFIWTVSTILLTGISALLAGWLAWNWMHPIKCRDYFICAVLTILFFHVSIAIEVGLYFMIYSFIEDPTSVLTNIILGLCGVVGAFIVSFFYVGIYTFWLCFQTAVITKGIVWIINNKLK